MALAKFANPNFPAKLGSVGGANEVALGIAEGMKIVGRRVVGDEERVGLGGQRGVQGNQLRGVPNFLLGHFESLSVCKNENLSLPIGF